MLRTHTCGELRPNQVGVETTLTGWVDSVRDHGGVTFLDLRDRYGRTQVTLNPDQLVRGAELIEELRLEKCVLIRGVVQGRPEGMINAKIPTGAIEVVGREIEILGSCPPLPFSVSETSASAGDDIRFRYRFLDMRREKVRDRFLFRSKLLHEIRDFLYAQNFVDVETPILTKSTPEGARDFLVPSRLHPGTFYALPQSPQIFKQLCMVGGLDRYMQVVKCFRDEDLRADRQPEFTQLDLEMSFVDEDDVMGLIEAMMKRVIASTLGVSLTEAFPRLTYQDAMRRFGCDAPDLRYGLEIVDATDIARGMEFRVFRDAADGGGAVRGIHVEPGDLISRKDITELESQVKEFGALGLAWARWTQEGWSGPVSKFMVGDLGDRLAKRFGAQPGSLILFVADKQLRVTHVALNELRKRLAQRCGLLKPRELKFAWVVDFPLLDWDEEGKRYVACHHPFTSPKPEDEGKLETDPGVVRARAYDLVLNGIEVGGGSIRIHRRDLQQRLFQAIGIGPEEAEAKFEFLLEGLRYGAPPHGGIALGVDRLVMLLLGLDSIREVIAFPKSQRGSCFLTAAPTSVDDAQLRELHIQSRPVVKQDSTTDS